MLTVTGDHLGFIGTKGGGGEGGVGVYGGGRIEARKKACCQKVPAPQIIEYEQYFYQPNCRKAGVHATICLPEETVNLHATIS